MPVSATRAGLPAASSVRNTVQDVVESGQGLLLSLLYVLHSRELKYIMPWIVFGSRKLPQASRPGAMCD